MTRVLLVHQPTDGGVGRHVADLATGLIEQGHEVVLCGPSTPLGPVGSATHIPLDLQRSIAPRADLRALSTFTSIVNEVRPDVIHSHSSKAGAIVRVARLRHPRIPVIYTPHGYAFAGHFESESERRTYREIERVLARLASCVLCVCRAEARLARTVGPATRVRVVYNGIETPAAGPADGRLLELAQRGPVVCALTQLRPGKGIETLIDALPHIHARTPHAQIAIGGEGPDLESLRARARACGVADSVHFLGQCDNPMAMLRGAQIFVHPSWAESFPYVILEAMAVGLPIVASDVGGVGEAIADGESGMLVPPRNSRALARAVLELLENRDRAAIIGSNGRLRLRENFTRERMSKGIARVYQETIRKHRP